MAGFELEVKGLVEHQKTLEAMLMNAERGGSRSLGGGQKSLYNSIRSYLKWARTEFRKQMIKSYRGNLTNDPHRSAVAVSRNAVKSDGGLIWTSAKILQPRTAGSFRFPEPPKVDRGHQRGGNRAPRSKRTIDMLTYGPRDRGFILRFLEGGTKQRTAGTRSGKFRGGNRGAIAPRNIFSRTAPFIADEVMKKLAEKIEKRIVALVEKGTLMDLDVND
jgi:hypothetical protein